MAEQNKKTDADEALAEYWRAADEGRLLLKTCDDCHQAYYYPRPRCPICLGENTRWIEASGAGEIYSFSVERRADPPHAIAYVNLAEGPTILTSIVDTAFEQIEIGARVQMKFERRDEQAVPVFEIA